MTTPKFHPLTVSQIRTESQDAISLVFAIPPELQSDYVFVQGQHLTLKALIKGQEVRRSYSICAAPMDGELRIAIKQVTGGIFSTWAHDQLKVGSNLDVMTPEGHFYTALNSSHHKHYVAFVAGSGITPILSIIKTTLHTEPQSRFTLVYGNRRHNSAMFIEALEDLKNRYLNRLTIHYVFSREEQEVPMLNGRLDAAKTKQFLQTLIPPNTIDEAFICGPNDMIDAVEQTLISEGVAKTCIHTERFGVPQTAQSTAALVAPGDAAQATVTVIADGLKRHFEFHEGDTSLLDVALKGGMDLPFSCKGGVCSTCRCKVIDGEVRMSRNFALEPDDVAAGFVLSCQAHPLTQRVTISFDNR